MSQESAPRTVTCDECKATAELINGWLPFPWFHVEQGEHGNDQSGRTRRIKSRGDHDFCGLVCASAWFVQRIPQYPADHRPGDRVVTA